MSSLEVVDVVAPYAKYMIASQETEPGWGWCYIFLSALSNEVFQNTELEKAIIDLYMYYGDFVFAEQPQMYTDLTLSCINLKNYQAVEESLNKYFAEVRKDLNAERYAELVRARNQLRELGAYSTTFQYGMVDLIELLKKFPQTPLSKQAQEAVEDMIVYSCSNMDNVHGVSICYPTNSTEEYEALYSKVQNEIGFAEEYGEFLLALNEIRKGMPLTKEWNFEGAITSSIETVGEGEEYGSDISISLTEEQVKNYAGARFTILRKIVEDDFYTKERYPRLDEMYVLMFQGSDVVLDENNILHAYYGNEVIYTHDLTENRYSDVPFLLKEVERTDQEIRYHVYGVLHDYSGETISEWEIQMAEIQVVVSEKFPNGVIRGVIPYVQEDGISAPAKQLLQLEDFSLLTVVYPIRYYTESENGRTIAYSEWEASGAGTGIEIDLTHEFVLEKRTIEDRENYVCIFEIIDSQGKVSYSELIPLK